MTGNTELIDEYRKIHAETDWGGTSIKNFHHILPHIRRLRPKSVIDYGCGKSPLIDLLDTAGLQHRKRYDPAIEEYSTLDKGPHDLLINIDVLEHVPEDTLDDVLSEMASICRDALIIVDTKPAKLILADGRNAHVTLHPQAWWKNKLEAHFGPLVSIRARRRGRAAFRTWPVGPLERLSMPFQNVFARIMGMISEPQKLRVH